MRLVTHILDANGDGQGDYAPESVAADALQRALRTLVQGAGSAALLALLAVLVTAFTSAHGWSDIDWLLLSFLAAQAVLTSVFSWLMRKLSPPPAQLTSSDSNTREP